MYRIDVLIDIEYFSICTYMASEYVFIGEVVKIDFRNKEKLGLVIANPSTMKIKENVKYKYIKNRTFVKFNNFIPQLIKYISQYYHSPLGKVASLFLNKYLIYRNLKLYYKQLYKILDQIAEVNIRLSQSQLDVVNNLSHDKPNLIFGVTGSGKTEVYFHILHQYIKKKKQVLILLPEINLACNIAQRFKKTFGFEALLWHSQSLQKTKTLNQLINNYPVVIGTRSSLFLPYQNLACIIVDEEHDLSYKQDAQVLYHARDMAILIASLLKIQICLFSATPTLESYYNAKIDKYNILYLNQQYSSIQLPEIKCIKSDDKSNILHNEVLLKIHKTLEKGEQVMLFLNRKGFYRLVFCKDCSEEVKCKNCSIPLVWYQKKQRLYCHYCDSSFQLKCINCNNDKDLKFYGLGIEQLYEYVLDIFKDKYKINYITSETKNISSIIDQFSKGEINIIITTQVMAKGYHFSNLTLVVMLNMDLQSCPTNFRFNEQNMQMIYQVRGRCGREKSGEVILQAIKKKYEIIPYNVFIENELILRKKYDLPPFKKVIGIIISGYSEALVEKEAYEVLKFYMNKYKNIMGPVESLIYKINNMYRLRIFITTNKGHEFLGGYIVKNKECNIKYDIDIYNFF